MRHHREPGDIVVTEAQIVEKDEERPWKKRYRDVWAVEMIGLETHSGRMVFVNEDVFDTLEEALATARRRIADDGKIWIVNAGDPEWGKV